MKHNLLKSVIISVILLMGVSNAWADAFWPYAGFYEVYMTYSYNGNNSNYTFRSSDNGATDVTLGTLTTDINVTSLYMKYYKNTDDWGKYGNVCGALMIYNTGSGDTEHQPDWGWDGDGTWHNDFQAHLYELSNKDTKTLVKIGNSGSGNYTLSLAFKMWGSDDNDSDCGDNWWISNNSQNYKFKYTILPPAVSSIGISATDYLAGSGTEADPYIVAYGASLKLTASVTKSDANSDTHYKFGNKNASTTPTYTISNITSSDKQSLTITAQNINKTDNSLKGNSKTTTIYYKYSPLYVYVNGTNYQFDNNTKKVTVALTQNNGNETYAFKIHDNSSHWLGNDGTMERGGTSVHSGGWEMNASKGDCHLKADLTGDYTFTFIPTGNKVTVTYPTACYIAGSWDHWAAQPSIQNTPVTIRLEKGTYEFKIFDFQANTAKYYGCTGTMTRTNCTDWTMYDGHENLDIEADITGNYTFTFNKNSNKLTVSYPAYEKTKTIYLNINEQPTWVAADAKMAVRYDGTNYDMTPIGCDAKGHYLYSCDNVPIEKNIRFVRINPNNTSEIWNESPEYAVPAGNNLNCFKMTDWGTGNWGTFEEIYPVTLDPHANLKDIDFGSYSVRYNGTTYTSKPTETVTFYAPVGAQIEILEGNPINDAYYARVRAQAGAYNSIYGDNIAGQTITVCGQTGFDNEFLTRASHVVYLGVPNTGDTFKKWRDTGYKYFIWLKDCPNGGLTENTGDPFTIGSTTYYKFEIPAGNRNFEFQRKVNNDGGSPYVQTIEFPYEIPTTNINCFTLTSETDGVWSELPGGNGDFRLLYIEQEIAKEDWKTVINTTYQHSSDFIRKNVGGTDIVSLHVKRNKELNPEIILQQMKNGDWVDLERHMVMGPLQTDNAGAAMLPGRRNAAGNLIYDDGIEVIKNDGTYPGRVYNFKVQQFKSTATNADTAKLLLGANDLEPYEGNYYIRTDNAVGGWNQYLTSGNVMNYSKYAEDHSGFSHYFCKYVDITADPKNVKFVIANDHGTAISDELDGDDFVPKENDGSIHKGELQESANVRWSWSQYTNEVKRAYIKGSSVNGFLTVTQTGETTTNFKDNGNWIYEADITAAVGDKITAITAPYRGNDQSLLELTYQTGGMPLLTGDPSGTHVIHVMYDFKINKTMALLVPGTGVKTTIDVLIERTDHEQATQVANAIQKSDGSDGYTVYAALNFTENNVVNAPYTAQRLYYWVSFPFDVRISEVFGFGEYGKHWIMQYYDGAARAANGAWADSPSYWRNITDTANLDNSTTLNSGILKANQGYVLALAKKIATMGVFEHTDEVTLYFPSMNKQDIMQPGVQEIGITLDPYQCTINRPTPDGDRRIKDSHWHVLGVPSYSDHSQELTQNDLMFFYQRDYTDADGYTVQRAEGNEVQLQSLHSYYVQFAGTINWSATWDLDGKPVPGIAARKNVAAEESHNLRLELQQNGVNADQTFITLKDEDGITPMFDMNKDLSKIINSGSNIYTLIDTETGSIEVAGNTLPIASTIIPVGVQVATAGEYTFAMPDGTDGIIVELVDYDTNTRTNLLLSDYTVTLPAGTNESRFALHVQPSKVTTSTENISGDGNTNTKKYLLDGVLYLQKDGVLYDAQGQLIR